MDQFSLMYDTLTELGILDEYIGNTVRYIEDEEDVTLDVNDYTDKASLEALLCEYDHDLERSAQFILLGSFVFEDTAQGLDYWKRVAYRLGDLSES